MAKPGLLQVGPYPTWDQEPLDAAFDIVRLFDDAGASLSAEARTAVLAEHGHKIKAIAARADMAAGAELINACPNLEIIAVYGVGCDAIDVALAESRGILVTNTPDVLNGDVADLAIGMWLMLQRRMAGAEAWIRNGDWASKGAYQITRQAHQRRAGILGLGRIGATIARRLVGFDMDIAYNAQSDKGIDWTYHADVVTLAQHSDVLFVAAVANEDTRQIVNAEVLRALGPEGVIINITRGQNIDEEALLTALETGGIAGAGLDVFEGEPHVNPRFLALENVVLQPHVGSATIETRKNMGRLMRNNLTAHFEGRPVLTPVW
ncbi:MAG: 2-hydroxyacid dehydrogenase [Pikeienuella sp.]